MLNVKGDLPLLCRGSSKQPEASATSANLITVSAAAASSQLYV